MSVSLSCLYLRESFISDLNGVMLHMSHFGGTWSSSQSGEASQRCGGKTILLQICNEYFPQIFLGPFSNTMSLMILERFAWKSSFNPAFHCKSAIASTTVFTSLNQKLVYHMTNWWNSEYKFVFIISSACHTVYEFFISADEHRGSYCTLTVKNVWLLNTIEEIKI